MRDALRELVARAGDPAPAPAESERGTDDRRDRAVVELQERRDDDARRHRKPRGLHRRPELRAVLGAPDRRQVGADQLDAVLGEHTGLRELHREVQSSLPAEGRQ